MVIELRMYFSHSALQLSFSFSVESLPHSLPACAFLLVLIHLIISFLNHSLSCLCCLSVSLLISEHKILEEIEALLIHALIESLAVHLHFLNMRLYSILDFLILCFLSHLSLFEALFNGVKLKINGLLLDRPCQPLY